MHLQLGQILDGKYAIDRLVGQGGMGAVYEARHLLINRRVAIKVLYGSAAENPEAIARFEREAQVAGRIGCDHIVEILDLGMLPDGGRFIAMEYLDGEPLSARISRLGRLVAEEARSMVLQILAGIAAAHRAGIVHRDLKPDNVFILPEKAGRRDFVKIIDFGISKFHVPGSDLHMTQTGVVMGTPLYMSPEQVRGEETDARSDIYSTGVVLYEALTGQRPFSATNYNDLIVKIALSRCPPASTLVPDLPHDLASALDKALARDREDRFQSAEQFAQALQGSPFPAVATRTVAVTSMPPWAQAQSSVSAAPWSNTGAPEKAAPRSSNGALWLGLTVVVMLVGVAAWLSARRADEGVVAAAPPSAVVSAEPRREVAALPLPATASLPPPPAVASFEIPAAPPAGMKPKRATEPTSSAPSVPTKARLHSTRRDPAPTPSRAPARVAPVISTNASSPEPTRTNDDAPPDLGY